MFLTVTKVKLLKNMVLLATHQDGTKEGRRCSRSQQDSPRQSFPVHSSSFFSILLKQHLLTSSRITAQVSGAIT